MRKILQILCTVLLTATVCHAKTDTKDAKCSYSIDNIVSTVEKVAANSDDPEAPITFRVYATGDATYTHKNGATLKEIVNLDQGVTVLVKKSDATPAETAKKMGRQFLTRQAEQRLAELCKGKGCNDK